MRVSFRLSNTSLHKIFEKLNKGSSRSYISQFLSLFQLSSDNYVFIKEFFVSYAMKQKLGKMNNGKLFRKCMFQLPLPRLECQIWKCSLRTLKRKSTKAHHIAIKFCFYYHYPNKRLTCRSINNCIAQVSERSRQFSTIHSLFLISILTILL